MKRITFGGGGGLLQRKLHAISFHGEDVHSSKRRGVGRPECGREHPPYGEKFSTSDAAVVSLLLDPYDDGPRLQ